MSIDRWNRDDRVQLNRVEQKLDVLISALAAEGEEDQEAPAISLDGDVLQGERDHSQSLG